MKPVPDRPIRLGRQAQWIDETWDPADEEVRAVQRRSYYDMERQLEELKLRLHLRESRIEELEQVNAMLKKRINVADECLVLVGHWSPKMASPIEKAIWVAWLKWAASMPDVQFQGVKGFDLMLQQHGQTYDYLMDLVVGALDGDDGDVVSLPVPS